jgi:hypothetical protein
MDHGNEQHEHDAVADVYLKPPPATPIEVDDAEDLFGVPRDRDSKVNGSGASLEFGHAGI